MTRTRRRYSYLAAALWLGVSAPSVSSAQTPLNLPDDLIRRGVDSWFLRHHQARLQRDLERGDPSVVNRDLNRIRNDEWRVWRDERWIRRDLFLPVGPRLPRPTPVPLGTPAVTPAAVSLAGSVPTAGPAPAPVPVVVTNTGPPGAVVEYTVDGVGYRTDGGQRQSLLVGPRSAVSYDRGGGLGRQRYALSAGTYEFRQPAGAAWALVKLKPGP